MHYYSLLEASWCTRLMRWAVRHSLVSGRSRVISHAVPRLRNQRETIIPSSLRGRFVHPSALGTACFRLGSAHRPISAFVIHSCIVRFVHFAPESDHLLGLLLTLPSRGLIRSCLPAVSRAHASGLKHTEPIEDRSDLRANEGQGGGLTARDFTTTPAPGLQQSDSARARLPIAP